jgi:hypothetical protein
MLRSQLGVLRDHFGGTRGPFAVQRVELAGGRTAVLVSRTDESDPIVLVLDRDQLSWSKKRPAAGIVPPVNHPTIAPRPDGGVALFVYVATLHMLAARMWADDGNPFAEIEVGSFDTCDALSVAYAPRRGWFAACTSTSGTRGQRLREDGMTAWTPGGTALSVDSAPAAAIAFDTASSFVLIERARAVGGDRLLASRFDDDARPLWPAAVDAGPIRARPGVEALQANVPREGVVRVSFAGSSVQFDSAGTVRGGAR